MARTKLRLIHDATRRQSAPASTENEQLTDADFTRRLLTANHGPTCAAYLIRSYRRSIRKVGYFVARIPNGSEMPMWFSIALQFLTERNERWEIRQVDRPTARLWKVSYLRHGRFARKHGAHLRVM